MQKRICTMIDDDVDKKLRLYQSKLIQKNHSSFSYSRTINEVLKKHLK